MIIMFIHKTVEQVTQTEITVETSIISCLDTQQSSKLGYNQDSLTVRLVPIVSTVERFDCTSNIVTVEATCIMPTNCVLSNTNN